MYVVMNHLTNEVTVYGSLVILSTSEDISLSQLRYAFGRKKLCYWSSLDFSIYKAPLIKGGNKI